MLVTAYRNDSRSILPQGHDGSGKRDNGDGVETGEMRDDKVNRGKDHDEIGKFDFFVVRPDSIMSLLQRFPSSDHIHYTRTHFHH